MDESEESSVGGVCLSAGGPAPALATAAQGPLSFRSVGGLVAASSAEPGGAYPLEASDEWSGTRSVPLAYRGEPLVLGPDEGVWIPVQPAEEVRDPDPSMPVAVFPTTESPVEVVPGLWDSDCGEGMVFVVNVEEFDVPIESHSIVAELAPARAQTEVCDVCGVASTYASPVTDAAALCTVCGAPELAGATLCSSCHAGPERQTVLSYAGCTSCRPERLVADSLARARKGERPKKVRTMCARAACQVVAAASTFLVAAVSMVDRSLDVIENPVYHIVEEPGGIARLTDCEVPTEEYYSALNADRLERFPRASTWAHEHAASLETFLDTSILAGFSFGAGKAKVAVTEGTLLGHVVSRKGAAADGERTQAIRDFAPLKGPVACAPVSRQHQLGALVLASGVPDCAEETNGVRAAVIRVGVSEEGARSPSANGRR